MRLMEKVGEYLFDYRFIDCECYRLKCKYCNSNIMNMHTAFKNLLYDDVMSNTIEYIPDSQLAEDVIGKDKFRFYCNDMYGLRESIDSNELFFRKYFKKYLENTNRLKNMDIKLGYYQYCFFTYDFNDIDESKDYIIIKNNKTIFRKFESLRKDIPFVSIDTKSKLGYTKEDIDNLLQRG